MKKRRKILVDYINKYANDIVRNTDKIWIANVDKYKEKTTNSWFKIREYEDPNGKLYVPKNINKKVKKKNKNNENKESSLLKCLKIELKLNKEQKNIFNDWFNAYIIMYNKTLKHIKKNGINSFYKIRSILIDERNKIINGSQNKNIKKKTTVKTHILDTAIKLGISNYESALTNLRLGNIKHFRIRYWKFRKISKILEIEKGYFRKNTICNSVFGKIKAYYNNKEFSLENIEHACKLRCEDGHYTLFVPYDIECENVVNDRNFISLDPGIRTFMTGLSNNEVIKIGDESNTVIRNYLNRIDNCDKIEIKSKRNKVIRMCRRKIKNMVEDLHWKAINYMTKKYNNILIGDMSVKGIVSKSSSLSKMNKRIAYSLGFYKFKQRLEYKCSIKGIGYEEVDERYTSKMCSNCGWLNEELGGNKVFDCLNCKINIDRDVNGCRGIYIKYISK